MIFIYCEMTGEKTVQGYSRKCFRARRSKMSYLNIRASWLLLQRTGNRHTIILKLSVHYSDNVYYVAYRIF